MMKLLVVSALIAVSYAQMSSNPMAMMSMLNMMKGSGSGSGGSSGAGAAGLMAKMGASGGSGLMGMMGGMGGLARFLNNPMLLCRQTENFQPVPCANSPMICDLMSFRAYKFPGLMKCSPMGLGCCIKDLQSLTLVNQMA